ncbi:unnamed protein product [Litomosoides sigmodontis]|uniref:Uncharacterized protein n=1 Tax=Litomosoides sigmodontis TaxID=42156 RepID=A0A3P6TGD7_LITSI|nr:unnamed protein product [Litomosoides sigmodontis]
MNEGCCVLEGTLEVTPNYCASFDELVKRISSLRKNQLTFDKGFEVVSSHEREWCKLFADFIAGNACCNARNCAVHSDDMLWLSLCSRGNFSVSNANLQSHSADRDLHHVFLCESKGGQLQVYRRQSPNKPLLNDPSINWEETVCLNLILQQLDFQVTCAVCIKTSPQNLQILRKNCQRVYPSPSKRRMDSKGECEEITYPKIYFAIDDFEQVFSEVVVRDGECVCVELVARDRYRNYEAVIFLGSIRYEVLKQAYDARTSFSWHWTQKFITSNQRRREFVRMRGPHGKGYAEMAVMRLPNCGYETPVSEQSFSFESLGQCGMRRMSDTNLSHYPQRLMVTSGLSDGSDANRGRRWQSEMDTLNQYREVEASSIDDVLNEGMMSRLWSVRGFGQAWHRLREKRRAESTPLNAFLTYITLPWSTVLEDLLMERPRRPILTFDLDNLEVKSYQ